ncbi:MAG: glucosaminidase domain-containing protein [Natronospirillum sp.]|uniref:glucosaminidase domain-containing protein n=1 Tax=Natronospirillum sp. TaxID=2812955 RepID=UPI0025F0A961|nr:glucosaminidase domain-containing protein [Natronospirillum sp.]MCH8551958.1 glucosaminidase domain-containing protein [Natronospirillum sp.]
MKNQYPDARRGPLSGLLVGVFTLGVAGWGLYQGLEREETIRQQFDPLMSIDVLTAEPEDLPDFAALEVVQERKDEFYDFLLPIIHQENARLLQKRAILESWSDDLAQGNPLPERTLEQLNDLAERYYVELEQDMEAILSELLLKIDVLPPSLIVAQAANESAWGTSRFAREGNNLFGQWCFSEGCGLVPQSRPDGEIYEVRAFDSPAISVRSFLQNLNRHFSYEEMREARAAARDNGQALSGLDLAPYLLAYSTRREAYVEEIKQMIRFNNLQALD